MDGPHAYCWQLPGLMSLLLVTTCPSWWKVSENFEIWTFVNWHSKHQSTKLKCWWIQSTVISPICIFRVSRSEQTLSSGLILVEEVVQEKSLNVYSKQVNMPLTIIWPSSSSLDHICHLKPLVNASDIFALFQWYQSALFFKLTIRVGWWMHLTRFNRHCTVRVAQWDVQGWMMSSSGVDMLYEHGPFDTYRWSELINQLLGSTVDILGCQTKHLGSWQATDGS